MSFEPVSFFRQFQFHQVIDLPAGYEVYDFTGGYDPNRARKSSYGIGRYNEKRPGMYTKELFLGGEEPRDVHVGIDIGAPVGTPVRSFYDGRIYRVGINSEPGSYGGTVITEHRLIDRTIWALYGHLSHASVSETAPGASIRKGDVIGWIGAKEENGGWNPHLHFQLSWLKPEQCDLPGVVSERDRAQALCDFPDPRFVLGPLY